MSPPTDDLEPLQHGRELDKIISLQEACRVSSLSVDGWKRHHASKLIKLSPRRLGVRLRDALMLGGKSAAK